MHGITDNKVILHSITIYTQDIQFLRASQKKDKVTLAGIMKR